MISIPNDVVLGAATDEASLPVTANQFVDKIDPIANCGSSKRRRLVNRSRHHTDNEPDLQQLPLLKGIFINCMRFN